MRGGLCRADFFLGNDMSQACVTCGVCCASLRVSFYWSESDEHPDGTVPHHLVVRISPYHVAMRGTETKPARCVALQGEVGTSVGCKIYAQRGSTCRAFKAGEPRCNQLRTVRGMPPLPEVLPDSDDVARVAAI